ncbi:MAG TPA: ROK family protein [Gemmataceae bacterium]|nr:ROK family protein [Gemmataceae bacterium]
MRKNAKRILVVDVGGTHVKLLATGARKPRKLPSGPALTPLQMVAGVREVISDWKFDAVSIGYPGPVRDGMPLREPVNLGSGWVGFDFEAEFGCPVRMLNDAAMQAVGSYDGGRMLFLGLGTGLGSALVFEKVVAPLELAHLPYRKGRTFEEYLGRAALERFGRKKWQRHVEKVVEIFRDAFVIDQIVLGGGNVKKLERVPIGTRLGDNSHAFTGGFRMWEDFFYQ